MTGRAFVFSHPNHELAVFGMLQAWRPHLVFLTDGGGAVRVAETRRGLAGLGLLDRATFLDRPEGAFYAALVERDRNFFGSVIADLSAALDRAAPERIYCDAVEFYNPVHDMSLPLVLAAGAAREGVSEVPLIWQAESGGFTVQRPAVASAAQETLDLSPPQLETKLAAARDGYASLRAQLGAIISGLPREHAARETAVPSGDPARRPAAGQALRYERRAQALLEQGRIERPITHEGHVRPMVAALLGV